MTFVSQGQGQHQYGQQKGRREGTDEEGRRGRQRLPEPPFPDAGSLSPEGDRRAHAPRV